MKNGEKSNSSGAHLGFDATLWASDKLRVNIDTAEYKYVVLGLIFLKYISDAFSDRRAQLLDGQDTPKAMQGSKQYFWVNAKDAQDLAGQLADRGWM